MHQLRLFIKKYIKSTNNEKINRHDGFVEFIEIKNVEYEEGSEKEKK